MEFKISNKQKLTKLRVSYLKPTPPDSISDGLIEECTWLFICANSDLLNEVQIVCFFTSVDDSSLVHFGCRRRDTQTPIQMFSKLTY